MVNLKHTEKPIRLTISKTLEKKIRNGYPWVFEYQLLNKPKPNAPTGLGVIYDSENRFLALGLYDPDSPISLRILQTRKPIAINSEFFRNRLEKAWKARKILEKQSTNGFRIVNGENDRLPGLIIDRYNDTLSMKVYSAAWFPFLSELRRHLDFGGRIKRCVLRLSRNVTSNRIHEGMLLFGRPISKPIIFRENGLFFQTDVLKAQKTGFYFDQRENRQRIRNLARNKNILNVFSYTGAFSIYAFAGGCRSVLEIESNPHALKAARTNIELNFPDVISNAKKFKQLRGNAFELLDQLAIKKIKFDLVILDPPALAREKKHKPQALNAYSQLAKASSKLIVPGGTLLAASCSRPIKGNEFCGAIHRGITAAKRVGKEFMRTGHGLDHPVGFEGGSYLKAVFWNL